ncbi:MAG: type II secretion system F family protein [Candidatus Omnitrophica bacterium]|nr:type II secretion system F family protein [Candidatus Omnitrophota bacterium]
MSAIPPFIWICYFFLIVALSILCYYGVNSLLKRWDTAQQTKAQETAGKLENMFLFVKKDMLSRIYIVIPIILGFAAFAYWRKWWLALIVVAVGFVFPVWLIKVLDGNRRKKFITQLVDGLMVINSCLKGGLTLVQSFEVVSEEMSAPLSQEISLLNREIKMGVTLEEALLRLTKRMESEEMILVSSAILVARETGGDLTKVFARLVETIRDRLKLKELVQTLTLQARLQCIIISLLGPIFFIIVRKIRPDHFDIMLQDDLGRIFLIIAVVLQIIGFILIIIFGKVEI